eukprot:TRINITY_DN3979_c0_g1_i1.p1 TRINITY_DN3979_c0_g1~~TRINITY_DN3979_c0_g1_i1.p1  ORF type:complete len:163 (+),score=57.49 TRINITY_DN3979_c0_g1_i1:40-489(+)
MKFLSLFFFVAVVAFASAKTCDPFPTLGYGGIVMNCNGDYTKCNVTCRSDFYPAETSFTCDDDGSWDSDNYKCKMIKPDNDPDLLEIVLHGIGAIAIAILMLVLLFHIDKTQGVKVAKPMKKSDRPSTLVTAEEEPEIKEIALEEKAKI